MPRGIRGVCATRPGANTRKLSTRACLTEKLIVASPPNPRSCYLWDGIRPRRLPARVLAARVARRQVEDLGACETRAERNRQSKRESVAAAADRAARAR